MGARTDLLPIAVVGCDFRTASSSWRSKLVLSEEESARMVKALRSNHAADGFVELVTCNRNEWIVSAKDPKWAASLLRGQMISRLGPGAGKWFSPYVMIGGEAALHVLRVAVGLESLMLGERQVSGQLNNAIEKARRAGSSSRVLNGLGTAAGHLAKAAAKAAFMGKASVGVHSLAIEYLRSRLPQEKSRNVALAGLGTIGKRVLGILEQDRSFKARVFNRTVPQGGRLHVAPLAELRQALASVDAAVICTGSPHPVLKIADLPRRQALNPLVIVDIGIPEQVERGAVQGVEIVGLDDLVAFHAGRRSGQAAVDAKGLEGLIEAALGEFRFFCRQERITGIIDTMQKNHGTLVYEEIPGVLEKRLPGVPRDVRTRLEKELRTAITDYTRGVLKTIREA
jgi:glutamyl-tRNA reductase